VEHLTTALALLENLSEAPERARQELDLLIALGPPLAAVRGQAAPEVEHTYRRAHALCQQVGDIAQLAPALVGLRVWYSIRGMRQAEREMGEQLLDLAQRLQDPHILLEARRSLGMSYFMSGEFVAAHQHLEQGLILASSPQRHALSALPSTQVPGVQPHLECLVYIAYTLWYLGYPDQALQRSHEAVHLAQGSSHPYSLALALASAAWVHQHRRETSAAQELAEAAMTIAAEHGFIQREAIASIRYGWTLAMQGQAQAGIGHLQQGLAAYRATGAEQMWSAYLAVLAEVYAHAGHIADGLAALHEAMTLVDARVGFFYQAELYRLQGELLLQQAGSPGQVAPPETSRSVRHTAAIHRHPVGHTEAEACFRWALEIAGRQHAKALELRAAMSLSRLWQQQGQHANARRLLAPMYGWFTEGFDTADLQEARALLQEPGVAHAEQDHDVRSSLP
jgi:predicted ATPase